MDYEHDPYVVKCLPSTLQTTYNIVYVLLGISPTSNCSWPTFRNPVSVPSHTLHPAFEDGTDTGFRNVGQIQFDAGEIPKRTYTIFKSRRKFEIKNTYNILIATNFSIISAFLKSEKFRCPFIEQGIIT